MTNIAAIVAGVAFVTLAAANVMAMLEASHPSRDGTTRARLIAVHRVGGYLFVIMLCIMAYSMSQRLAGLGITGHLPTHLVLHIVLVLVLVPLLLLKVLIARRYKQSHSALKALGIAIFIISFVLVSIPALSELLRSASQGSLWLRLSAGLIVAVCLVHLSFCEKETVACSDGVIGHYGDPCAINTTNKPRKPEEPHESSVGTDRAADARYEDATLPDPKGKTF
jgi:hypothetical protein